MGLTDPNPDLADQLVGLFARATAGEMPARVIRYRRDQVSRPAARVAGRGSWGLQPVVIFAIEEPVVIRVDGRDSINLQVGDAAFLSARDVLETTPGGSGRFVAVETHGTQPCRFFVADAADPLEGQRHLEIFCTPFVESPPECWRACHEIHCLLESAQRYAQDLGSNPEVAMRSVLRLAAIECSRALRSFRGEAERPAEKSNPARVRAAEIFISCHIGRDIRKSELAEYLGVSVSQLTLAFREIGGLAVRDRIRFRRVESARSLLADTDLSVAGVAARVGMNYRHFIRAFRQSAMLTPLRYRKYVRRGEKSPETWDKLLHTEHFERVQALDASAAERSVKAGNARGRAVTVLISNATSRPAVLSLQVAGGAFSDIAIVAAEKRLAFLDRPGRIWKIQPSRGELEPAAAFFATARTNSHFVFDSGYPIPS